VIRLPRKASYRRPDARPALARLKYPGGLRGLVRRPSLKLLAVMAFGTVAAVAAALGCPVFRNPGNYMSAGGLVGYVKYVVDVHRKH